MNIYIYVCINGGDGLVLICVQFLQPMDCSSLASSVLEKFSRHDAEWKVAIPSPESSRARNQIHVSCIEGNLLYCRWILAAQPPGSPCVSEVPYY